jgi:hypothetical protein
MTIDKPQCRALGKAEMLGAFRLLATGRTGREYTSESAHTTCPRARAAFCGKRVGWHDVSINRIAAGIPQARLLGASMDISLRGGAETRTNLLSGCRSYVRFRNLRS